MIRKLLLLTLSLLMLPAIALAVDLSGTWRADDGGTYYLREKNGMLHWYGEQSATSPRWANVFHGKIHKDRIKGSWIDVPKGQTMSSGDMELRIRDRGNVLEAVRKTGGFGGSRWTRVTAPLAQMKPMPPMHAEMKPAPQPHVAMRPVKEDCIGFDPNRIELRQINGRWKIVEGGHWLFDFGNNSSEARRAYDIIRAYRMNQSCFVGRPDPSFTYMKTNNHAPQGAMKSEDCVGFDPNRIEVRQINGSWKVVEGGHWLFDFGGARNEAEDTAAIIRKYAFTRSCFVGRPNPSFSYMRR